MAALSTSGMMAYEIPEGVTHLDIYADGDFQRFEKRTGNIMPSPGLQAAEKLEARAAKIGLTVKIHEPPHGSDWLDVWNGMKG